MLLPRFSPHVFSTFDTVCAYLHLSYLKFIELLGYYFYNRIWEVLIHIFLAPSLLWCTYHAYVGSLCCSVTKLCLTLKDPMNCSTSGFPVLHCLHIELMSIELVMLSNHLILCRPLLLLPSNFTSISVFSSKSVLHIRWPKYWSFSFSTSPSNEYSVLISFRIDWFDLLVVHGTLENLLQYHSSKASVLQHLAFFMV